MRKGKGVGLAALVLAGLVVAGCQTTAETSVPVDGPAQTVQMTRGDFTGSIVAAQNRVAPSTRVYLIRGLADVFSRGMDDLAVKLQRRGYIATLHTHGEWDQLARTIADRHRLSGGREQTVIIGHSLGADSVVNISNALAGANIQVALAVSFDPVTPAQVIGGARRFVNIYQSNNGWAVSLRRTGTFRGQFQSMDLRDNRNLNHFNIEKDARLHEMVMGWIAQTGRGSQRASR